MTGERTDRGAVRGAAMIEFVILTVVMVPLFFGIPMIGKLVDLRQTSIQASRYAVWEATVQQGIGGAPPHLRERFFGDPAAPILADGYPPGSSALWGDVGTGDVARPTEPPPTARRQIGAHTDYAGGWAVLSAVSIDDASVDGSRAEGAGPDGAARRVGGMVESVGSLLGDSWQLSGDGMVGATVRAAVRENGWLGGGATACGEGFACVSEPSMILVDGWSSPNDAKAERRVKQLVPMQKLEWLGDTLHHIGSIPVFKEFDGLKDAFGHVDMDQLAADERGDVTPGADVELDYYEGGVR